MKETERQLAAFKCYVSLGWKRSYSRVAQKFGVHPRTVERWGRTLNWVRRAAARDAEKATASKAAASDGLDVKHIVRTALATFVDWLKQKQQEGQPACASVTELEKLVKLDLMLSAGDEESAARKEVMLRFKPDSKSGENNDASSDEGEATA